jgi:hypothetical protein
MNKEADAAEQSRQPLKETTTRTPASKVVQAPNFWNKKPVKIRTVSASALAAKKAAAAEAKRNAELDSLFEDPDVDEAVGTDLVEGESQKESVDVVVSETTTQDSGFEGPKSSSDSDGYMGTNSADMPGVSIVKTSAARPKVSEELERGSEVELAEEESEGELAFEQFQAKCMRAYKPPGGGSIPRDRTRQPASHGTGKRKRFVGDDGSEASKRPAFEDRNIARLRVCTLSFVLEG